MRWIGNLGAEYGLARLDRLRFYNSFALWRENMVKEGVNLRDPRYGFRHFAVQCAREFARSAMVAGIVNIVFMTPTKHKILNY